MRQLAAILFTDMQGYTALMARDEAHARHLRDRHREVLRDCHERYGGEILHFFGDGTLSLFSSAVEAVRCAVVMQRALQEEPKVPLRIGLHFGEVVRDEEGLYGNAVNIASRLESLAAAGSILISARLREELSNHPDLQFRSLGLFELKNVPRPMEVFAVANEGILVPRPHELEGKGVLIQGTAPALSSRLRNFVGREKELDLLRRAWSEARAGQGTMIGIAGEPGIGKTTLVEDFLLETSEGNDSCIIARGRCSERLAGTEAYLPFLEILDDLIQSEDNRVLLKQLAPAWYVQLRPYSVEGSKTLELATQTTQERRKLEIGSFLREIARRQSLLLFIDDLHWADASTTELFTFLAPDFSHSKILFLATYRPVDMKLGEHPFLGLQPELQAKRLFREILLPYFGAEDIRKYLDVLFAQNHFETNLSDAILRRTGGNPLFLADLVSHLKTHDVIYQKNDYWQLKGRLDDFDQDLPDSINGMIRKKLERVGASDLQLLTAAAVQGYEFDVEILAAVTDQNTLQVADRLQVLEEEHHLVQYEGERQFPIGTKSEHYRFVHALYQNALFNRLRLSHRNHWSKQIAGQIIQLSGDRVSESASELARLFELADDPDQATKYLLKAAQQALAKTGYEEVVVLVSKGLDLLKQLPDHIDGTERHLEFQLTLGPALMVLKGFGSPDLGENYRKAKELCNRLEDTWKAFKALNGMWLFAFNTAEMSMALDLAQEMKIIAEREADDTYMVVADHALADILLFMGELKEAQIHYERVIASYLKDKHGHLSLQLSIEDPGLGAFSAGSLGFLLLGHPEQAQEWCAEGIKLGRHLSETFSLSIALVCAQTLYASIRESDMVLKYADEALGMLPEQENPMIEAWSKIFQGWGKAVTGEPQKGVDLVEKGLSIYNTTGAHVWHFIRVLIIESYLLAGNYKRCDFEINKALELSQTFQLRIYEPEVLRLKGESILNQQQVNCNQEAEKWFRQSIELAQSQKARFHELRATVSLARLWQQQGIIKEAHDQLKTIYDWFTEGFDTMDLKEAKALLDELKAQIEESNKPPSIAVLPFVNMSSDPDQEYFCDGVTEEILNALAQVRDLRVIARTSAFSFKGQNVDIREIARQLGVDHVLEGSVRKAGNRLRITAQLINAGDNSHLWSERFDRELGDVFAIQDEIAVAVTNRLVSSLIKKDDVARPTTDNLKAYDLYLQGRFFFHMRTADGMAKALDRFQKAVTLDPQFALAYTGIADTYILTGIGYGDCPFKEAFTRAEEAARRALTIDDQLAEAHTSLGYVLLCSGDKKSSGKYFERALNLNPSLVQAHQWYAQYWCFKKRHEKHAYHIKKAVELDPLSILLLTESGWPLIYTGRYEEGLALYEKILTMDPSFALARYNLAICHSMLGHYEQAIPALERAAEDSGNSVFVLSYLGFVQAQTGNEEKALQMLDHLVNLYQKGAPIATFIADIHIGLEDKEQALDWLERAEQEDAYLLLFLDQWIAQNLGSKLLDYEPRYRELLKRLGLE